jgi:large subunit ribosomal protein L13
MTHFLGDAVRTGVGVGVSLPSAQSGDDYQKSPGLPADLPFAACLVIVAGLFGPDPLRSTQMKTVSANAQTVKRDWYIVDATDKTLGRLASELAHRLRGKHKPVFTPHCDTGDYLVVVNAEKVAVTGNKLQDKQYHRFTGYIGNLKTMSLRDLLATHPERAIEIAVKGMLPKNPLGRAMARKLKVYKGAEHPHTAQQPQALNIG